MTALIKKGRLWKMFQMYGFGGKLLNNIKSLYLNNKVCGGIRNEKSD